MSSFSKKVKRELCSTEVKIKNCCGYSLLYGMLCSAKIENDLVCFKVLNEDVGSFFVKVCSLLSLKSSLEFGYNDKKIHIKKDFIRYWDFNAIKKNIFRCGKCREFFLKGVFLVLGSVNDPEKSYRLEIKVDNEELANNISGMLSEMGIDALKTVRAGKYIVYVRRSEGIEDFFANIGATSIAFDIMNSKITKDLINNANRITNCDSANINKSLGATNKYINIIKELMESGDWEILPPHLKEVAEKRLAFKELSFVELGKQFSPPISKSGVYHRLEKIVEFYNDLKNN